MNNSEVLALIKEHQVSDVSFPSAFETANGVRFTDIEGNTYLDLSSGYGVVNIGWQHPEMIKALQVQAAKSNYAPPWMLSKESALLGQRIDNFIPGGNYKILRSFC